MNTNTSNAQLCFFALFLSYVLEEENIYIVLFQPGCPVCEGDITLSLSLSLSLLIHMYMHIYSGGTKLRLPPFFHQLHSIRPFAPLFTKLFLSFAPSLFPFAPSLFPSIFPNPSSWHACMRPLFHRKEGKIRLQRVFLQMSMAGPPCFPFVLPCVTPQRGKKKFPLHTEAKMFSRCTPLCNTLLMFAFGLGFVFVVVL